MSRIKEENKRLKTASSTDFDEEEEGDEEEEEEKAVGGKTEASTATKSKFIRNLFAMAMNEKYSDAISFSDDGAHLEIRDTKAFSTQVLPIFFKHGNISSFVRQLNNYEFKHCTALGSVPSTLQVYQHKNFRRGRIDLLSKIQRRKGSKKNPQSPTSSSSSSMNPLPLAATSSSTGGGANVITGSSRGAKKAQQQQQQQQQQQSSSQIQGMNYSSSSSFPMQSSVQLPVEEGSTPREMELRTTILKLQARNTELLKHNQALQDENYNLRVSCYGLFQSYKKDSARNDSFFTGAATNNGNNNNNLDMYREDYFNMQQQQQQQFLQQQQQQQQGQADNKLRSQPMPPSQTKLLFPAISETGMPKQPTQQQQQQAQQQQAGYMQNASGNNHTRAKSGDFSEMEWIPLELPFQQQ